MAADLASVQAYQAAVRSSQSAIAGQDSNQANSIDFGNMVSEALNETSSALNHAEQMTAAAARGEVELVDVVTAVAAAEITLETVIAVRDEVVRAYQEILRMPI